jgi:hypothetical protein
VLLPYQIVVQGDDQAARPTAVPSRRGDERSPDQARALISSIRRGWRNGSAADPNPDSDNDGAQA